MLNYKELAGYLSEQRLATYLQLANGDESKVAELYIENLKVSEKFYTLLISFEVFFRNQINDILSESYGENWYNSNQIDFIDKHVFALQRVKQELHKLGKQKSNPNIVSNLTMGFWVYLFNKDYDRTLWRKNFYKMFGAHVSRSVVREELHKIKNLRNRIAHAECILKYPHERYYNEIIDFIGLINKEFASWIAGITKI